MTTRTFFPANNFFTPGSITLLYYPQAILKRICTGLAEKKQLPGPVAAAMDAGSGAAGAATPYFYGSLSYLRALDYLGKRPVESAGIF